MKKRLIETSDAPKPIGPYSQAVLGDGLAWISMQLPFDPDTGLMVEGNIEEQTRRVLENLRAVAYACGAVLSGFLKVTVYFTDLNDFERVNRVYAEFLGDSKPARAVMQVSALPKGAVIAMDAVALVED